MKILGVFFLRGLAGVMALFLNITLARVLGADGAGLYVLSISIIAVATILGCFGLDRVLLRKVAAYASSGDWAKVVGLHRSTLAISFFLSALIGFLLFMSSPLLAYLFDDDDLERLLLILSLAILPLVLLYTHADAIKGLKLINSGLFLKSISVPMISICLLVFIEKLQTVEGAVVAYLLAAGLSAMLALVFWFYLTRGHRPPGVREPSAKELLSSGSPLLMLALFVNLQGTIPIFLLGVLNGAADIAYFYAAMKTALVIGMLIQAVNAYYEPRFAERFHKKEFESLERMARQAVKIPLVLATPVLCLLLLYPEVISIAFGHEFSGAAPLLMIMAIGQFFNVVTGPVIPLLTMSDLSNKARDITVFGVFVSIVLYFVLIPIIGVLGASIAHAVGLIVKNLVGVWMVKKYLGVRIWSFSRYGEKN
jgi:O-antigen/teichoic acid export membrane protein